MNWLYIIGFILFFAWFEGINAGTEERIARETHEHARKAYLLAACLDGKGLQVGDHIVDCKVRK